MSIFVESGFVSLNKYGEELCGDRVETIKREDSLTIVLADGLGSGVKANILATLTSKIIGTMMANGADIEDAVETIANTLPVCSLRGIAYSTFSILQIYYSGEGYLVEFDNPEVLFLKNGKSINYEKAKRTICGKNIYESRFPIEKGDLFILTSDGVIHAGVGKVLNLGWQMENVKEFVESKYNKGLSAKSMVTILADACNNLYMNKPGDDTTIAALRIRENEVINIMVGPPVDISQDSQVVEAFMSNTGIKIICGGTTSQIVSRHLKTGIKTQLNYVNPSIPPVGYMRGIDLITEGVLTLGRVLELSRKYISTSNLEMRSFEEKDGASLLANFLFEKSTCVNFYVGRAMNPAHQNPELPLDLSIKLRLVKDLAKNLELMGKSVNLEYY